MLTYDGDQVAELTARDPEPGAEAAIRTRGLEKTYTGGRGAVHAVRGIDLEVRAGEFFGLLGPNGAGKSTTVGMLTTLVRPSSGQAFVAGIDVAADRVGVKRRIGVVPQKNTLDRDLTVSENLEFRARFFGSGPRAARHRAAELLEALGLADRRKAMANRLSGGQARRLMIGRALVHRPEVLFLDEPTTGLDPQTRIDLRQTLRTLHADGQAILLTTHYMEEAEALCERVAVMDHGKILACGTVDSLKRDGGADTIITVRFEGKTPDYASELDGRPGISKVEVDADQVRVFARDPGNVLGELVAAGVAAGVPVRDAVRLSPSLETVFFTLTGREYHA